MSVIINVCISHKHQTAMYLSAKYTETLQVALNFFLVNGYMTLSGNNSKSVCFLLYCVLSGTEYYCVKLLCCVLKEYLAIVWGHELGV